MKQNNKYCTPRPYQLSLRNEVLPLLYICPLSFTFFPALSLSLLQSPPLPWMWDSSLVFISLIHNEHIVIFFVFKSQYTFHHALCSHWQVTFFLLFNIMFSE